jgi:hypothetical protein
MSVRLQVALTVGQLWSRGGIDYLSTLLQPFVVGPDTEGCTRKGM